MYILGNPARLQTKGDTILVAFCVSVATHPISNNNVLVVVLICIAEPLVNVILLV